MTDIPSVSLWCGTKVNGHQTGVRRYEDAIGRLPTVRMVRRPAGAIRGCTPVSWALDYRANGADVVHAAYDATAPAALLRRPAPLVVSSHGPIPIRYPSLQRDRVTAAQWRLVGRALARADRVIANSAFTKGELRDVYGLGPERVTVVPLGVDHDRFRPMDGYDCKRRLGLDPNRCHALVMSSTLPQKRMDIAASVAESLATRSNVRVVKAGYGEEIAGENVVNLGWVDEADLPALYNAADVLLHPSEYESFGLPVLEAMACATPVVAADATAVPEVVGDAGTLVDLDGDEVVRRFADAVLDSLVVAHSTAALRRSEEFSWGRVRSEIEAVYRGVSA